MKKKIVYAASLLASVIVLTAGTTIARAVFNGETEAVHINPDNIENSTLIIGTHLIHISKLTDELYDAAMDTARASGQMDIYYKSELAGGTWYMISDASGLSDITSPDKKADNSFIGGLYLRYHTKSDGITYDLLKNTDVCIFDTVNPYAIGELAEMDALNTQYANLKEKENATKTDKENKKNIEKLINKGEDLEKENMELNKKLEDLYRLYLHNTDSNEVSEIILEVMEQVDALRRANVYKELVDNALPDLLNKAQLADREDSDGLYVDYGIVDAVGMAMEEADNKLIEYEAKALTEGETAMARARYNLVNELSDASQSGDDNGITDIINSIRDLDNIGSGITVNADSELSFIVNTLLPMADEIIKNSEDLSGLEKGFAEGEFLAKAAVSKMSAERAEEFVASRIQDLEKLIEEIGNESLRAQAEVIKNDESDKLRQQLSDAAAAYSSEMDSLLEKKQNLQTERLKALDENNPSEAQNIQQELSSLEEEIESLEKRLNETVNSDTAGEEEKAMAMAALDSNAAAASIADLKEHILNGIKYSRYEGVLENLDALSVLAQSCPGLAAGSLKDIYKSAAAKLYLNDVLENKQQLKEIMDKTEDINAQTAQLIDYGPDKDELEEAVESVLGGENEELSDMEQAAAAAALAECADSLVGSNAAQLAAELAVDLYNNDNMYIFDKLKNEAEEFIPLDIAAKCCSYRYIFHEGNRTAVLRSGKDYYEFCAFSKTVMFKENQSEEMNTYARYQSSIYIPSEYLEDKFQISCTYIPNTDYGILITQEMEELLAEITEGILNTVTD